MTQTLTAPEEATIRPVATPDAILVAQSILRGVLPPDLYWNIMPHCSALEQDGGEIGVYLQPKEFLGLALDWEYLTVKSPPTSATERALSSDPTYRARLLEHAILDSLQVLNRLTEDGLRQQRDKYDRSQGETRNPRLRHRLAAAVHEELAELLAAWNQVSKELSGLSPVR